MDISEKITEARREYYRQYRRKNADKINARSREWRRKNPDKCREYAVRYWEKKALEAEKEEAARDGEA